jgi:hypothetical protein
MCDAKADVRESLIKSLDPEGRPSLTGKSGELLAALMTIESNVEKYP